MTYPTRTLGRMQRRVFEYAVRWWWLDLLIVGVLVLAVGLTVDPGTGIDVLGQLGLDERRRIYTDMLQLAIIFGGFGGIVFAIFLGLQSKTVTEVKSRVGHHLIKIWLSALLVPWVAAFAIVAASILDRGDVASVNMARWLAVGATVLVAIQLVRVSWVFYNIAVLEVQKPVPTVPVATERARIRKRNPAA